MGNDYIPYGPDPFTIGRRDATASRTEDGVLKQFSRVIVEDHRVDTFRGTGATFAIPGNAALAQPLWSIENITGSGIIVAVRDLYVQSFAGAASATIFVPPAAYTFRTTTMPTGGTAFTKVSKDTRDPVSSASVIVRQGASADGVANAIVAPLAGPRLTQRAMSNWASMVGFAQPIPSDLLEGAVEDELVIQPGQAIVIHANANVAADNAATRRWFINFAWIECTEY